MSSSCRAEPRVDLARGTGRTLLVGLLASLTFGTAAPAEAAPDPGTQCTVADRRLAELSGLAVDGADRRWAIADSGRDVRVYQVGVDCAVGAVRTGAVDPLDAEDLARAPDGTFWLADTGDNNRSRPTVAMIELSPRGVATLHRLRYPDGPHDAEAVLLGRDGVPLIVTKEPLAPAGIYRPERGLTGGQDRRAEPVALRKVGQLVLPTSDTRGGPVGALGSRTITGGATTQDGAVVALRTYTDAWLFAAPDGDLVAALARPPVRVPLPGEPQGEAIAFTARGDLVSGSERRGAAGRLRTVPGAAALVSPGWAGGPATATEGTWASAPAPGRPEPVRPRRSLLFAAAGLLVVLAVGAVVVGVVVSRRRANRWRT